MAKSLFHKGMYGIKANGKWGKLSGGELINHIVNDGWIPDKNKLDRGQINALERAYEKRARATNKKISELEEYLLKSGNHSHAYDDIQESGGKIREKAPSDLTDMFVEIVRMQQFEDSETSTPQGVEYFQQEFEDEYMNDADFQTEPNYEMPDLNMKWNYLRRIQDYNPNIIGMYGNISDMLDEIEMQMVSGTDMDAWIIELFNRYENASEEDKKLWAKNRYSL